MNELTTGKTMTTKEVAEALGVSERSILNIADSKGYEKFFIPLQTKGRGFYPQNSCN